MNRRRAADSRATTMITATVGADANSIFINVGAGLVPALSKAITEKY